MDPQGLRAGSPSSLAAAVVEVGVAMSRFPLFPKAHGESKKWGPLILGTLALRTDFEKVAEYYGKLAWQFVRGLVAEEQL